jgi:hypothetical protein
MEAVNKFLPVKCLTEPLQIPLCSPLAKGERGDLRKTGVPLEVAQNSALYSLENHAWRLSGESGT